MTSILASSRGTGPGPRSNGTRRRGLRDPRAREPERRPRIAILGTGQMGSAIAGRLADAGFEITLWNRTRSRAEALGLGQVVDTPAAAVRDAEVVISSLADADAVRSTYLGRGGATGLGRDGASRGGQGKLFVEMSSVSVELMPSLAADVEVAGGRLVDAPILGAPGLVRGGQAAILIGGTATDVDAASAVLGFLGTVRHVGPLGSATRLSQRTLAGSRKPQDPRPADAG